MSVFFLDLMDNHLVVKRSLLFQSFKVFVEYGKEVWVILSDVRSCDL